MTNLNSPKKDMKSEERFYKINRGKPSKTSFKLNEDHEERIVSNRSKEKVKTIYNHPINSPETKKSHKSPTKNLTEDEELH